MHDHFARLPEATSFSVTSASAVAGAPLAAVQMSGRAVSPQLSSSVAPEDTKSYAVIVYDPDAPPASVSDTGQWPASPEAAS